MYIRPYINIHSVRWYTYRLASNRADDLLLWLLKSKLSIFPHEFQSLTSKITFSQINNSYKDCSLRTTNFSYFILFSKSENLHVQEIWLYHYPPKASYRNWIYIFWIQGNQSLVCHLDTTYDVAPSIILQWYMVRGHIMREPIGWLCAKIIR